jgi:hypothetical protein
LLHFEIGLKLSDDTMKQARGERVGDLPFETPIACDPDFQFPDLALSHDAALPAYRRLGEPVVSLKNFRSFSMVDDR